MAPGRGVVIWVAVIVWWLWWIRSTGVLVTVVDRVEPAVRRVVLDVRMKALVLWCATVALVVYAPYVAAGVVVVLVIIHGWIGGVLDRVDGAPVRAETETLERLERLRVGLGQAFMALDRRIQTAVDDLSDTA